MDLKLKHCFLLSMEEPGDYIYSLAGVVVVFQNQKYSLYCASSQYNRIRAALNRVTWEDLMQGIVFRETGYRTEDITAEMASNGWNTSSSIPAILAHLWKSNPRHLFFLERYLQEM
ncbi:MAG: hypothetical protein K6T83_05065 [Alicyclobacillus sp.]|nr:hypothetical protein [Alicyclobacillus sp.]